LKSFKVSFIKFFLEGWSGVSPTKWKKIVQGLTGVSTQPEVIITVGHQLKSGQLAGLLPISLFGLTNVRSTRLSNKQWFSPALLF